MVCSQAKSWQVQDTRINLQSQVLIPGLDLSDYTMVHREELLGTNNYMSFYTFKNKSSSTSKLSEEQHPYMMSFPAVLKSP